MLISFSVETESYYITSPSLRHMRGRLERNRPRLTAFGRAQDFLPFLPRRFLLIGGKRCDLYLAPCLCFRRYATRARASAFSFSSAAFFSAARRLIASIVSSLCGIAIVSTPPTGFAPRRFSYPPATVVIYCGNHVCPCSPSLLFFSFASSLLAPSLRLYHTAALFKRHLPSNFIRQPAQLFADALGLFLVTMHDGILKRCAAEATLRRGDSPTANPKGAQASARVKSLDRPCLIVSLRHRHSLYYTFSTQPTWYVHISSISQLLVITTYHK